MAELAGYDFAGLGRLLRPKLEADGRGWRACAFEIGVSPADLSRVSAGQAVSAPKIFAICDWLGVEARDFYNPPQAVAPLSALPGISPTRGETGRGAAAPGVAMFHGKSTETAAFRKAQDEEARA